MIVIQDPVIHTLRTCPVVIDSFELCRAAGNGGIEADIPFRFCINTAAISGGGAGIFGGATVFLAAGHWTTPFDPAAAGASAPVDHPAVGLAQWGTICVNGDFAGNRIRPSAV